MINRIISGLRNLLSYSVFIGRRPKDAPERSIILFPLQPETLNCGLAGVLAIKGAETDSSMPERFSILMGKTVSKDRRAHV